jgi:hypothetical protein
MLDTLPVPAVPDGPALWPVDLVQDLFSFLLGAGVTAIATAWAWSLREIVELKTALRGLETEFRMVQTISQRFADLERSGFFHPRAVPPQTTPPPSPHGPPATPGPAP